MRLSQALGLLCEPPQRNFTLSGLLRRGWPGFADVVLLPKVWELGRAARLVERVIFWGGGLAGIIYYGDLPLVSPGKPADFTDALELLAIVKGEGSLLVSCARATHGLGRVGGERPDHPSSSQNTHDETVLVRGAQ